MARFETLDAWKSCQALVLAVLQATKAVRHEPSLIGRLCFTALRAAAKLAFGAGTGSRQMFRQATARSCGYLSEFGYHLSLVRVMGVLPETTCTQLDALRGRATLYTRRLLESLMIPRPRGGGGGGGTAV